MYPKTIIVTEFDGGVRFKDNNKNAGLINDIPINTIEADGKTLGDFSSKVEFLNFISELVFNKGGAVSGSGAYIPVYQVTSFGSFVGINDTTEIEVKGSFLDYINTTKITASNDDNGVSVSIKSKTFSVLVLEVVSNSTFQDYTVELSAPSGQIQEIQIKTANIIIPITSNFTNVSNGISVGNGVVQTNSTATGWNKQAVFGSIPANTNGELSFTFEGNGLNGSSTNTGMIGLGIDPNSNTNYNTIDHAIYVSGTNLYVYENGSYKGNFGNVSANDSFKIERQSNIIRYYKNSELFYTSTIQSTGELFFDCSLYRNIKFSNLKMVY